MSSSENNSDSRKEEILARSRQSKKDEGVEYAALKGNKLGEITMAIVAIPIIIFALLRGEFAALLAVGASVSAFTFAQCLAEYRFTGRQYHLAWTIFTALATLTCVVLLVAVSFGWWEPRSYLFELLQP